ncbi:MAG TPA: MFS transporter [Variovorax sp.]|nr:MFS transporter [Variovorax sp.]
MSSSSNFQPARAWGIAWMLAALQLVNFVDKVVVGLVAIPMMADLGLTPVQFGVVAGSVFWLFAVGGVVGGFLANRIQTRWLLLAMAIAWSVVQVPIAATSSLVIIVIARVLLGLAEGPSAPVAMHSMYKWFPDDKRNLPGALINVGATLGVLVAGLGIPFITSHWGWRANFWVLALIGLIWAAVWMMFGAEGTIESEAAKENPAKSSARVPYARLLTDPTVIGVCVLHFVAYWIVALTLTWLPAYMNKGLGFEPARAGLLFAMFVFITVPISFGVSWYSERRLKAGASSRSARAVTGCIALLICGVMMAAPQFLDLGPIQKVVMFAIAAGLSISIFTLAPSMIAEVTPLPQRGAMLAIENAVFGSAAGVLAPVVMGKLIESRRASPMLGYEQGFALSGILTIAGGIIGILILNPARSKARIEAAAESAPTGQVRPA